MRVPEGRVHSVLPSTTLARALRGTPCLLLPCVPPSLIATSPMSLTVRLAATVVVLGVSLVAFTRRKNDPET